MSPESARTRAQHHAPGSHGERSIVPHQRGPFGSPFKWQQGQYFGSGFQGAYNRRHTANQAIRVNREDVPSKSPLPSYWSGNIHRAPSTCKALGLTDTETARTHTHTHTRAYTHTRAHTLCRRLFMSHPVHKMFAIICKYLHIGIYLCVCMCVYTIEE